MGYDVLYRVGERWGYDVLFRVGEHEVMMCCFV